uniref:Uncharacterized protein n=1 Tax=Trepomonas sp. PC1 TaxID=1076344 RepID=A0A146K3B2_9EUKA|eukprot:JAP90176.1 Hypothetical protein TPC1_30329 [Trepomonas sp. PC1]
MTESRTQLSLELGTGYYLCKLNEIQDENIIPKKAFSVNGGDYKSSMNVSQKESSSIFIQKSFNTFEVPHYLQKQDYQKIIDNTRIGHLRQNEEIENFVQIHYYKQRLLSITDFFIDEDTLCSNHQIEGCSSNGFCSFDLFHVYLILLLQIKYFLFKNNKVDLNDKNQQILSEIKYSLPICASKTHIDFVDAAINVIFPDVQILQVTEPEAGFASLTQKLESLNLKLEDRCLVIDAGEGTIDCIKLHYQMRSDQQNCSMWRLIDKKMFLCGGSKIREQFISSVKKRVNVEDFELQLFQKQLNAASHKFYEQFVQKVVFDDDLKCQRTETKLFSQFLFINEHILNLFDFEAKNQTPTTWDEIFQIEKQQLKAQTIIKNYTVYLKDSILQELSHAYDEIFTKIKEFLIYDLKTKQKAEQVIFIGGLANSSYLCKKLKIFCDQHNYDFLNQNLQVIDLIKKNQIQPQMLIFQGIPHESQTVTTRNLNERAPFNLFVLGQQKQNNLKAHKLYFEYKNQQVEVRKVQKAGGHLFYSPIKIISKGEKLYWSQDHQVLQQEVHKDFKVYLLKTNGSQPPFLNFRDQENIQKIMDAFDIGVIDVKLQKDEINQKLGTAFAEADGIEIKILINFDVKKFVTQPFIEIQIKDPSTNEYQMYQQIEIWHYYLEK